MTDLNDLLSQARRARDEASSHVISVLPEPWESPTPLQEGERPEFTSDYLPDPLGPLAVAISTATQTPLALVGMMLLAATSTAVAKAIEVQPREGWLEPVNLYSVTSLGSGNRKSAVATTISKPLREWEITQAEAMRVEIAQAKSRREVAEHRLERMRKDLARDAGGDDYLLMQAEEAELTERLVSDPSLQVPAPPRLLIEDSTIERAAMMMTEQGGRIGVLSAEGGIFQVMAGRYSESKDAGLDLFLKSHAGDDMPIDRIGRETRALLAPALTLGLAVQPHIMSSLAANASFRGTGLLARFAYACPESTVGRRQIAPSPVPASLEQHYHELITGLLHLPLERRPLSLSPQAQQALQTFEAALEPRLGPDGDLEHLADWGAKLAGLVVRIAGLCHAVTCQTQGGVPWDQPISTEVITRAVAMAEDFLIPHAKTAFAMMGADPAMEQARQVLRAVLACPDATTTRRDLHQNLRRKFPRPEMLDRPLEILTQYGYVRQAAPAPTQRQGRKASPVYEINPLSRTHNSLCTQKDSSLPHSVNLVNSVYASDAETIAHSNGHLEDFTESELQEMVI